APRGGASGEGLRSPHHAPPLDLRPALSRRRLSDALALAAAAALRARAALPPEARHRRLRAAWRRDRAAPPRSSLRRRDRRRVHGVLLATVPDDGGRAAEPRGSARRALRARPALPDGVLRPLPGRPHRVAR